MVFFFFKQKTAYEMRISDWSSDVCSSDRYEGLTSIPVGSSPHDCVALEYAGGDKLYVPVENIDVLSRYGSGEEGASLDRLGGEAWQGRKSRLKERIREIAGELIVVAPHAALRPREGRSTERRVWVEGGGRGRFGGVA